MLTGYIDVLIVSLTFYAFTDCRVPFVTLQQHRRNVKRIEPADNSKENHENWETVILLLLVEL